MRAKVSLLPGFVIIAFLLLLSGCGASSAETPTTPYNGLDIYDINVQVHAVPQVNINQPFKVSVFLSSLYPFSSLYGVFTDTTRKPSGGLLSDLLQPPPSAGSKKFALCMEVALLLDDPSAFAIDTKSTPAIQVFTIMPDVTEAQSVSWNVIPLDTYGQESIDHSIGVDVAFDSQVSCDLAHQSLLGDSYHLVGSPHNTVVFAKTTMINPEMRQESEFVDARRTIAGIILPTLLTMIIGWMTGFFSWIAKRVLGNPEKNTALPSSQNVPSLILPQRRNDPLPKSHRNSWITILVAGVVAMGVGLLLIFFGPSTIVSFSISIIVAIIGIVFIALGAWRVKPGKLKL